MASLKPDMEIIEPPNYIDIVAPSLLKTIVIVMFLALFFPGVYLFLIFFFDNKIHNIEDLKEISDLPVAGQILHNAEKGDNVIQEYPMSPIAESFRTLRTNILFLKKEAKKLTILVTSLDSGEGKSFIALNIASGFAILNKKTIIVGFDLRKPNSMFRNASDTNKGLLSYLKGDVSDIREIIFSTQTPQLDFIQSGPVEQLSNEDLFLNPTELIESERTKILLSELKRIYDIIILDTPPLGPVADALVLMNFTDLNMLVIRQNITNKNVLVKTITDLNSKGKSNLVFIFNDVRKGKKYGYNGEYSYKYYGSTSKTGFFTKIINRKRRS